MSKASDFIKAARNEIGVKESPPNSNNVKYNTWFYGHPVNGKDYPWCMVFIMWIFRNTKLLLKTASCSTLLKWFRNKGKLFSTPKVGDIVFFKFDKRSQYEAQHCGIVTEIVSKSKIKSIEGNTSGSSRGDQSNGGMVCERIRSLTDIVGFGRPDYTETSEHSMLKMGDENEEVKLLQNLLRNRKYGCQADGKFGSITHQCVIHFQTVNHLEVDGIVGPQTWKALGE